MGGIELMTSCPSHPFIRTSIHPLMHLSVDVYHRHQVAIDFLYFKVYFKVCFQVCFQVYLEVNFEGNFKV